MMGDPQMQKMIQDMLFKYLFSGGQAPGGGVGGTMPNAQGLVTRYGG